MTNNAFGIDLGTNNIRIYELSTDQVHIQKNMIAIANKKELFAYGDSAYDMYEKAPGNIVISYPLCDGVIADINNMETILKYFVNDISRGQGSRQPAIRSLSGVGAPKRVRLFPVSESPLSGVRAAGTERSAA